MKTRITLLLLAGLFGFAAFGPSNISADDQTAKPEAATDTTDTQKPKLEDLLTAPLEGLEGREVIVSRVTIPPNTALPKHWHPGEEFIYVLKGSAVLWQEGKDDVVGKEGDVLKVPLKQVHTAITSDEGVTVLVFRVHEAGQPTRVLVDE